MWVWLVAKIRNMSMVWKFTIIFFILIMVPTYAFLLSYNNWTNDSIKQQSDAVMMQTISQFKRDISYTLINTENIANEIVFSSEVQAFLNNDFSFSQKELDYFTNKIQSEIIAIRHLYPNKYYKIRIYSSNNSIHDESDIIYSIDKISHKDFFKNIEQEKGKVNWGKVKKVEEYYDFNESIGAEKNNNTVIPLYIPIRDIDSNRLIGVLEIDILIEKMIGERWQLNLGDDGFLVVYDKDGSVISPNADNPITSKIDTKLLNKNSGNFTLNNNGDRYRIVYDTVDKTKYKIVTVTPDVSVNTKSIYFFVFIGTIFVFLITFLTTKFLFARLEILTKLMKRVEEGEFDVRIDESNRDEVGELAHRFNSMAKKLKNTIVNLIEKETLTRDAEIRALQSQINPHFLYNTLESIRMECETRDEIDIADAIASLGQLFRYNIKWDGEFVLFKSEIEYVTNFITIMQLRFKGKINYTANVSDEALNCDFIKMVLQPLVENCFSHAFRNKENNWEILINAYVDKEVLWVEICDNGLGIEENKLNEISEALEHNKSIKISSTSGSLIGLDNVNKRIKMQFGNEYGISIESIYGNGTKIKIKSPKDISNEI